jgi:hypothetical protein
MAQKRFITGGSGAKAGFPRTTLASMDDANITTPADGQSLVFDGTKWVNAMAGSLYWLDPVLSIFDNSGGLPSSPVPGSRYIAMVTAHGWIANHVYTAL